MPRKSFAVGKKIHAEPLIFELEGTDVLGQAIEPISFRCLPEVQGGALIDIVAAMDQGEAMAGLQVTTFIRGCLLESDVERFDQVTRGKDIIVGLETLGAILMWLVEEYSGRPTEALSGLPNGPTNNGPGSTGASISRTLPPPTGFPSNDSATSSTPFSSPIAASS